MIKVLKSRRKESLLSIFVNLFVAAVPILVILIISIWKKDIWDSNTFYYMLSTCIAVLFFGVLLEVLASRGQVIGFGLFVFSVLVNVALFILGIVFMFTNGRIFYIFAAAASSAIIYGCFKDNISEDDAGELFFFIVAPYILHIILVPTFASLNVTPVATIIICVLEIFIAYFSMYKKCKALDIRPFYDEASEQVRVDEETEEERKARQERSKERADRIGKKIDAWVDKHSSSPSGSKFEGYSQYDWCREFQNYILNGAFIYTSAYVEASSIGDHIYVTVRITNIRDDNHSNRISVVRSNFNKLAKRCPYSCSLSFD